MTRRVVVARLATPVWVPPGVTPERWSRALADDAVDLLATLAETEPALAVQTSRRDLAAAVAWPAMRVYALPELTVDAILAAAGDDGFEQAAVIAADAPDLPGMLIAKLLRPLTSREAAAAPDTASAAGLVGFASRTQARERLPGVDLDTDTVASLRAAAPSVAIAGTPGWRRLRGPDALDGLDPGLEGWDATRALLAQHR